MPNGSSFLHKYWPGLVLLFASLAIALMCYKDYGMSWDEPLQREMGFVSYDYAFKKDSTLLTYGDQSHGVAFELPLVFLEKKLEPPTWRQVYLVRHLATHLFFLLSVFCGYVLALRLFKDQFIACIAFVLLAFHPRIYAHSYFNTKDIPFLSALIIVFMVSQAAFEKKGAWRYALLGAVTAYATSIRAMGIMLVPIACLFLIIDIIVARKEKQPARRPITNFSLFVFTFCAVLYTTWPILWASPIHQFKEQFASLSHILWRGTVLLNGVTYAGDNLPWFYVPLWFCITIPVLWLAAGLLGIGQFLVSFFGNIRSSLTDATQRQYLLYLACFAGPVAAVIALHSVNYDDWRHLYFIYPAFVMFVLFALNKMARSKKRIVAIAICIVQLSFTGYFMVSAHPFQQVYFNQLVSHEEEYLRKHYDLEYWGCADKQALEYIAAHDKRDSIKVWLSLNPVQNNLLMLPDETSKRIKLVDTPAKPDYFITNFRNHPQDYDYASVFYEIKVQHSTILRVYKMR